MGFFGKIFGSAPVKEYRLDEAMVIIERESEANRSKNSEELYQTALKIYTEMSQLASDIDEFSRKETPELAKSSANVKERFCSLSTRQLNSAVKPDHNNPAEFIRFARSLFDSLGGLTQRQMIHINFFFKEDFKPVAKKINEINTLLQPAQEGDDHAKALSLYRKMKHLEEQKKALDESVLTNEENLKKLESRRHDLPVLSQQPGSHELDRAENKLKAIRQEIDSTLAIQKLLKKYAYSENLKDPLLEIYVESPSRAILDDGELKIIDYTKKAAELVTAGKIETDIPEKKINAVAGGGQFLSAKRGELIEANKMATAARERFNDEKERFEASIKNRTNILAEIDGEIKDLNKITEAERSRDEEVPREVARTRAELCMLASKLLGATVS